MSEKDLVFENRQMARGFTSLPNVVLKAKGLSLQAKAVYTALLSYAWSNDECFPGQDSLCEDLDVDVKTLRKYLYELKEYGLIDWKRRMHKTNLYIIKDINNFNFFNSDCQKGNIPQQDRETCPYQYREMSPFLDRETCPEQNNIQDNNTHINNTQSINQSEGNIYSNDKVIDGLIDLNNIKKQYGLNDEDLKVCLSRLQGKNITNIVKYFETIVKNYLSEKNIVNASKEATNDKSNCLNYIPPRNYFNAYGGQRKYDIDDLEKKLLAASRKENI